MLPEMHDVSLVSRLTTLTDRLEQVSFSLVTEILQVVTRMRFHGKVAHIE